MPSKMNIKRTRVCTNRQQAQRRVAWLSSAHGPRPPQVISNTRQDENYKLDTNLCRYERPTTRLKGVPSSHKNVCFRFLQYV